MYYETTFRFFSQPVSILVEYERDGSGVEGILIHEICLIKKQVENRHAFGIKKINLFEFIETEAIAVLAREIDKQEINDQIKAEQDKWEEVLGGNWDYWLRAMDAIYKPERNPWR
ncbi:MAG: hypothetical protein KDJ22_00330 [Candidatus Competibacteraceae bacterium]|nr:hypothetical protein [Candidatus Competibacteraceae bacterium]